MSPRASAVREIARDIAIFGSFLTLLSACIALGKYIGNNDAKWLQQDITNSELKIHAETNAHNINKLKQCVAKYHSETVE